jgi:transposase-like protein
MLRLIREAMGNGDMKDFSVFVEVDETYIGGKPRKENGKPKAKRGRGTSKTPVVGVIERGTGKVRAKVMLPDAAGKKLSGKQLLEAVKGACAEGTTVATDDFRSYGILDRKGSLFYHVTVNHSLGQFSAGDGIHTNTIESFWSLLKKQYLGAHHHYSVKYMQGYLDEGCDNGSADDGGGEGDKIPAELIAQWKIDGGGNDMAFEFAADKLIIPTYSGECEFSISGKHIKAGAKGTPAAYLGDFCTDYTIGSDGKLTLTGSQILGNSTFVKICQNNRIARFPAGLSVTAGF